jgi:cathepsin L
LAFAPAAAIKSRDEFPSFAAFAAEYKRSYKVGTADYDMRRQIYEKEVESIRTQNSNPGRLWDAAVNHLSDRTEAELSQLRGLRSRRYGNRKAGSVGQHSQYLHQIRGDIIPDEKSYANLEAVKSDVDQAACGSCWAVATATVLAAHSELKGYKKTWSAQELVDCVPNPHKCGGAGGCQGSTVELAMNWVMAKGLADTVETPYVGSDGTCKKDGGGINLFEDDDDGDGGNDGNDNLAAMTAIGLHAADPSLHQAGMAIGLTGWSRLPENEHEPLIRAVAFEGPVAVSVAATTWGSYSKGIFNSCSRDAEVDHAVVLVGYGIDRQKSNTPYWLIKNSWSTGWGENGLIRLQRDNGDYCGTDKAPEKGTACIGGPSEVKVCGMCGIQYDSVVPHFKPAR